MKLGLLTAALPRLSLEKVAAWSAGNGFEMLEVACWPSAGGERRRYAGASHIDVENSMRRRCTTTLDRHGLEISSLAYYPNNLHPDRRERKAANTTCEGDRRSGEARRRRRSGPSSAATGQERARTTSRSSARSGRGSSLRRARGVNIAIENCPMIFSGDEWPGGNNLATTPAVWDEMFSIPSKRFGLNLDPSHLVWLMIDYERVVRDYAREILHVHAKDLEIDRDGLYRHGTLSLGMGWQVPRLPGLGEVRWDRFIAALYRAGYDGVVSIEHEDRTSKGPRRSSSAGS